MRKAASPKQLTSLLWVSMFEVIIFKWLKSPLYVVSFFITMSFPVLLHSHLIQSSAEKFHKNIEGPHYERSKENDMYPSFVIVHYAGRVCTGFTTFNCFFCFLFYCSSIAFTPLFSRVITCTSAFILHGECGFMGMVTLYQVRAEYNLVPRLHSY